ncbi:MAG: DUF2306 domain-containing protein [Myxococcota bacterium]
MTVTAARSRTPGFSADDVAAASWLATAMLGQFGFFVYLAGFYATPLLFGDVMTWNRNPILVRPPVESGEALHTLAFGIHAIGAGIIAVLGGIQLIPGVRRRFAAFHRWNGRVFVGLVVALSLSGYYLTWIRGPVPDSLNELATSVNGLMILSFAGLAVRAAMRRRFDEHQRWAVRLFLVSNAQWFLRIGGFGYFLVAQSIGAEVSFESGFFKFWTWGCFLVPIVVAELHRRSRDHRAGWIRWSGIAMLGACTVMTFIGSFAFLAFALKLVSQNS